jgi:hypothetical protein
MEIIDESLDYSVSNYNHSTLHYRNVLPQTSADVTLSAASVVGPTQFVISSSCFNPAKSRLNFNVAIDPTDNAKFVFAQGNLLSTINRIVCYDMNTSAIFADINNVGEIYGMLSPITNTVDDLNHKAGNFTIAGAAAAADALTASNLRPFEDITRCTLVNDNGVNVDVAVGNGSYNQISQLLYADTANFANIRVSLPLSAFKHSFFSVDKMIYSPSNIAIDVYWEGFSRTFFEATAVADPATGAAAVTGAVLTNAQIQLCTEGNVNVASQIIQKTMSSGLSMPIGYISGIKQNLGQSTSQSLTLPLTAAYGKKILYVATAFFHNTQLLNVAKIHSRYLNGATTNELASYNSFINGVPILSPAGFNGLIAEDYTEANKQYLEGSAIQSLRDYAYQWVHIDNFAKVKICKLDPANVDGLDVLSQQANWQIQYNFVASTAYNHYVAVVGQKTMSITSQGAVVN